MSTNSSIGRAASKSKKDRSPNLCTFTFADGRQCRTPRCSGHLHLCYFHAQKEAEALAAQQVGKDISRFLPTKLLTACDLGVALSQTFCAVARGDLKPKVATALAYLAQTMLQSIPIAQDEYINSFDTNTWRSAVRVSFRQDDPPPAKTSAPQPAPKPPASSASAPTAKPTSSPAPQPPVNSHSDVVAQAGIYPDRVGRPEESASSSNSSLVYPESREATHHSFTPNDSGGFTPPALSPEGSNAEGFTPSEAEGPLLACPERTRRAPSPHTPLPPTSAEFAQQLLAGRNSSRSDTSIPSAPGRETGSADSSSSCTPSSSAPSPSATSSACSNPNQKTQPQPTSTAPRPVKAGLVNPACPEGRREPQREPGSSESSPSPAPSSAASTSDSAPARTLPTQPASSSTRSLSTPNNSQPAPTPPAPAQVPPGFGAPANWDVLIPPKPRRRFSRLWHQSQE